jgi:cyclophilin family peptidyl-prolyl cis-trans isomerase/dienelactone hydrolase
MKGLEALYRIRNTVPSPAALAAMRKSVRESRSSELRQLGLIALNRAGDRDRDTLSAAFLDSDPEVRRLAVTGLKEWRDDPSPLVRYDALRADGSCARAEASIEDPSEHVALLAIDLLGNGCSSPLLERIVAENRGWRRPAHALVSLAKVSKESARRALARFVSHPVWQARVYAARAAKELGDQAALETLRSDSHPNVIAEALRSPQEAVEALAKDDYGLLVTALEILKDHTTASMAPVLLETLSRISARKEATSRDPRRLLLERLRDTEGFPIEEKLDFLLSDFDPVIAALAASIVSEKTGRRVETRTKRFAPDPLPTSDFILALEGARARMKMKEAGSFVIELLPQDAPLTAARFAKLSESGYYRGLTFHRIVPNFVIQGGSPGANEYVGTPGYLRDEVSNLSHLRGTLGISTRGRDTGDSQIFVNLVDNFRLDHNYTVFARVIEGMENVDAIQEGDVIEEIAILGREDQTMPKDAGIHELVLERAGAKPFRYGLSLPGSLKAGAPLVLALHYAGHGAPYYGKVMLENLIEPALRELDAVIVAPDCPSSSWSTAESEEAVLALLALAAETYRTDPERVVLTGYSMGGMGTWYLAARHPERFSAAIPMAGSPRDADLKAVARTPLYAIHSRTDDVVPLKPTEDAVTELQKAGARAELVVVDVPHYESARFQPYLKKAVAWIRDTWKQTTSR